jgi:predicted 3-demethylubiquinone-9 3-methyltransferase (glyoxalase superfamily)
MASKSFKIGESAIGGIIRVDITGKIIQVKALDYDTKKTVSSGTAMSTDTDIERKLDDYLNELTSYYHAEKIMEWIKSKIKL